MDIETTVGHEHCSWVPDHLRQALQDQCCSKLQKWDLSLYRVCLLVYQVCVLSETLYSVQKLRVITGMHWTASLPQDSSPGQRASCTHMWGLRLSSCECSQVSVL